MYQLQKNAKSLTPKKVKSNLVKYLKKLDKVFFDLNIKQLEKSEGADNKPLINSNKKYSGFYTKATEDIAKLENPKAPKKAGEAYNFLYSGDFIKGFQSFLKGEAVEWESTGTGSGDKSLFFKGYKNLYGLDDKSKRVVIDEHFKDIVLNYYRAELLK